MKVAIFLALGLFSLSCAAQQSVYFYQGYRAPLSPVAPLSPEAPTIISHPPTPNYHQAQAAQPLTGPYTHPQQSQQLTSNYPYGQIQAGPSPYILNHGPNYAQYGPAQSPIPNQPFLYGPVNYGGQSYSTGYVQRAPAEIKDYRTLAAGSYSSSYTAPTLNAGYQSTSVSPSNVESGSRVPVNNQLNQERAEQASTSSSNGNAYGQEVKYTLRDPRDPNSKMQVVEMRVQSNRQMSPEEAEAMMNSMMGNMGMGSRGNQQQGIPQPQDERGGQRAPKEDVRKNFNSFLREIGLGL